jgi:hypothetical protein
LGVPIQGEKTNRKKNEVLYKLALEGWWMASWANHSVLWSCHLGRRWILGLSHPNLYAQMHYLSPGGNWNCN